VVTYNGATLSDTFTDTITAATYSTSYSVNIAQYAGANAFVGLSGGDGLSTSTQQFANFSYATPEPSTAVLAALAFLGVAAWRMRRARG
jgi:Flp pilus assembly CpaE family ATPase